MRFWNSKGKRYYSFDLINFASFKRFFKGFEGVKVTRLTEMDSARI